MNSSCKENDWLQNAVFYEIYPQSFRDANGDGIGDFQGIIEKLDEVHDTGFNAIWINPCYDSPFVDAGYDVRNYYKTAARYGTNADLVKLFEKAHSLGMHVLLDLVPGHTSVECDWFKQSSLPVRNAYTDRYIWTDMVWNAPQNVGSITGWLRGGFDRDGACATNFFTAQPALNYGFYHKDEGCDWEQGVNDEGPQSTRKEIEKIIAFWCGLGCDGFRVDMAGSLVKNDPERKGTIALWNEIFSHVRKQFPDARFVSEWGQPEQALQAGFDMDFLLHFGPSHYLDLFRTKTPFFAREGKGSLKEFFRLYMANRDLTKGKGLICIPSGNHDMDRLATMLDTAAQKLAFLFLYTMPGVPFTYYGDEIGMRKLNLPSHEGGYFRTGSRTPMQWNAGTNAGFSAGDPSSLYLPIDEEKYQEINLETEKKDPASLYSEVKRLLAFRKDHSCFLASSGFTLVSDDYPLIYERHDDKEKLTIVINPSRESFGTKLQQKDVIYSTFDQEIKDGVLPGQSGFILQSK